MSRSKMNYPSLCRFLDVYKERYERLTKQKERNDEMRRGRRRIDFLMGHSDFKGLSPFVQNEYQCWTLHLGQLYRRSNGNRDDFWETNGLVPRSVAK